MRSSLFPIVADIVLQDLELTSFTTTNWYLIYYFKYDIDDIARNL